jgi:hypothetical protein
MFTHAACSMQAFRLYVCVCVLRIYYIFTHTTTYNVLCIMYYVYTYIYIYICICMYVCVCVCAHSTDQTCDLVFQDFRLASAQQAERARSELRTLMGASHEILLTLFSANSIDLHPHMLYVEGRQAGILWSSPLANSGVVRLTEPTSHLRAQTPHRVKMALN